MGQYEPKKSDNFTFGLWTVGNTGRDPFGEPVRKPPTPLQSVEKLSKLGAMGICLHDNDLIPFGASAAERDRILKDFRKSLKDHNMAVTMGTANLFGNPVFKEGSFTAEDATVRAYSVAKTLHALDVTNELGGKIYVFWGGREGCEVDAAKDPREVMKRMRDIFNFITHYIKEKKYPIRVAIEPKPNEPRGNMFLPTIGHAMAFINTLDYPDMVGVNPEVAHEHMSGLNFYHGLGQALDAGKLFHVDLNDQDFGRFDQDFRFASANPKKMFFVVKLLEEAKYPGPKHFDSHPYRTEDEEGVWDFAAGSMRSYLILREKAEQFNKNAEIQGLLKELRTKDADWDAIAGGYATAKADKLKKRVFETDALAKRGLRMERLDQITNEILWGVAK